MNELKWYAVYTRPKWERKVTELLTKKRIINYCPLNRVQRQWSDRKKFYHEPLFASYVFVYVSEKDLTSVLQSAGVINFVYWLGKLAIISNEEIETLRNFVNEYSNVTLEKKPVNLNEEIKFISGPLISRKGNVLEVRSNTVKVELPSLGQMLIAEIRKDHIEAPSYMEESNLRI
jgi:transcription antitermination factor NusG